MVCSTLLLSLCAHTIIFVLNVLCWKIAHPGSTGPDNLDHWRARHGQVHGAPAAFWFGHSSRRAYTQPPAPKVRAGHSSCVVALLDFFSSSAGSEDTRLLCRCCHGKVPARLTSSLSFRLACSPDGRIVDEGFCLVVLHVDMLEGSLPWSPWQNWSGPRTPQAPRLPAEPSFHTDAAPAPMFTSEAMSCDVAQHNGSISPCRPR